MNYKHFKIESYLLITLYIYHIVINLPAVFSNTKAEESELM